MIKKIKIFKNILIISFLLFMFIYNKNCFAANTNVASINIKQSTHTIFVGKKYKLNVTILPKNATNKKIIWSSSNTNIVKVSSTGIVYGVKAGKATITAKTSNGKKDTCIIKVTVPAKSIKLNKSYLAMPPGNTVLTVNFNPTNTSSKEISWKSSNPSVVSVSYTRKPKATLTLKKEGTATITATSKYGLKATCVVRVLKKPLNTPAGFTSQNYYKGMRYYKSIPKNATEKMPLIIFLHGDGEVNKFDKLGTLPMVQYVKSNKAYKAGNFVFIAPMRKTSTWVSSNTEKTLMELIRKTVKDYKIDKNRIILTGMSSGGQGTWYLASKYPNYFAAIVPVSAKTHFAKAENLVNIPIWGICGDTKDEEPERNRQMRVLIAKINKLNGSKKLIKFETIKGATHGSVQQAFKRQELFEWMLAQNTSMGSIVVPYNN